MRLFTGPLDTIPEGSTGTLLSLDATPTSSLDWREAILLATGVQEMNLQILWEVQLGPITEENLKTLSLGLTHFTNELFSRFEKESVGIALYSGPLFAEEKLDCFHQLLPALPDTLEPYLLLDATGFTNINETLLLLDPTPYTHFKRAIRNSPVPTRDLIWKEDMIFSLPLPEPTVGLCWVREKSDLFLPLLQDIKTPYRFIPEDLLLSEWDGLDHLIVLSETVSWELRRKLQGFIAAGGVVVTVGAPLQLPNEISYPDFSSRVA